MGNPNQRIIVVNTKTLFGNNYFEGFRPAEEFDYESKILSNYQIMRRGSVAEPKNHPEGNAERNTEFKQPIGYTMIVNPQFKKVFAYQRSSKDSEYKEKRLQGKWSWGLGGHIEPFDAENGNPLKKSLLREVLKEEIEILNENIQNINILGYINDDSNSVGKVHFGILYLIETDGDVKPKDKEIAQGKFTSINELEKICSSLDYEVETWSKIALGPLRDYF